MRKGIILVFYFLLVFKSEVYTQSEHNGFAGSFYVEYKSYAANLGYGFRNDYQIGKNIPGISLSYSKLEYELNTNYRQYYYQFDNLSFNLHYVRVLDMDMHWEGGLSYTGMLTKADYSDFTANYYYHRFKGYVISQYAAITLAWKYVHATGVFIRPEGRLGIRTSFIERPDIKITEYYNGNVPIPVTDFPILRSYATFQLSVGFIFGYRRSIIQSV